MNARYEFIDGEYANPPAGGSAPAITCMCKWLGVSKSGYCEWRSRPEPATAKRREELKLLITKAFEDSDGTYGYRRVARQLARWGVQAGLELVRALMRELALVACQPRLWRPPDLVTKRHRQRGTGCARSVGSARTSVSELLNHLAPVILPEQACSRTMLRSRPPVNGHLQRPCAAPEAHFTENVTG